MLDCVGETSKAVFPILEYSDSSIQLTYIYAYRPQTNSGEKEQAHTGTDDEDDMPTRPESLTLFQVDSGKGTPDISFQLKGVTVSGRGHNSRGSIRSEPNVTCDNIY